MTKLGQCLPNGNLPDLPFRPSSDNFDANNFPSFEEVLEQQMHQTENIVNEINTRLSTAIEIDAGEEVRATEEILEDLDDEDDELSTSTVNTIRTDILDRNEVPEYNHLFYQTIFDEIKSDTYVFPTLGSMGWTADVHSDEILLDMQWVGPDGTTNTFDDIVDGQTDNRFYIDLDSSNEESAISGGQIYNPSSIRTDFSKISEVFSAQMFTIPSLIANLLAPNSMSCIAGWRNTQQTLQEVLEKFETAFLSVVEHTRSEDNDAVRVELTFALVFTAIDEAITTDFYWPKCSHGHDEVTFPLNRSFMSIKSSDKYFRYLQIVRESLEPLLKLVQTTSVDVTRISPEAKTAYVFHAERLVMITMNSFYEGKIHSSVKKRLT